MNLGFTRGSRGCPVQPGRRAARVLASAAGAWAAAAAGPAWAHGGATGAQEFFQHNLVTVGLAAILLAASAGLAWISRGATRTGRAPGADGPSPGPPSADREVVTGAGQDPDRGTGPGA
jgi:hypothetical protein